MSFDLIINILLLSFLFGLGVYLLLTAGRRKAVDVLLDLEAADSLDPKTGLRISEVSKDGERSKLILSDELAAFGLYEPAERARCRLLSKLLPLGGASLALLLCLTGIVAGPGKILFLTFIGALLGYFANRVRLSWKKADHIKELEFYLPIVMERVVMAVQAGLDVVAALKRVIELEKTSGKKLNPVSRLLSIVCRFAESGMSVEKSLQEVAGLVQCTAVRHAFIHLAMAYKEGGELVMPLTELSDSTQLYYQESVEEEIAKMPVKATMPLVLTFGGLIVCFIATPMIQVLEMIGKAMPH